MVYSEILSHTIVEEYETNLMSQFLKFYFTPSVLNMFRTLINPSSEACDFSIVPPHWLCVLVSVCVGVSVWLVGVVSVLQTERFNTHKIIAYKFETFF